MANKKEENARLLDPQRFQMAKSMAVVPGGPMNNNPMNIGNIDASGGSMSGVNLYPYGDSGLENPAQLGTNAVFPQPPSGLPQQNTVGRGRNAFAPYNQQPQPPSQAQDNMESVRLGGEAKSLGLSVSPMGALGLPSQPAPGGSLPSNEQSPGTLGLQGQMTSEVPPKGMNTRSGKRS